MKSYLQTKELYYFRLRVPKDEAYFVYFTLEAHEGLCFYSTSDDSLQGQYRDIEVKCSIEFKETLESLIKKLQANFRLDVIEEKSLIDS